MIKQVIYNLQEDSERKEMISRRKNGSSEIKCKRHYSLFITPHLLMSPCPCVEYSPVRVVTLYSHVGICLPCPCCSLLWNVLFHLVKAIHASKADYFVAARVMVSLTSLLIILTDGAPKHLIHTCELVFHGGSFFMMNDKVIILLGVSRPAKVSPLIKKGPWAIYSYIPSNWQHSLQLNKHTEWIFVKWDSVYANLRWRNGQTTLPSPRERAFIPTTFFWRISYTQITVWSFCLGHSFLDQAQRLSTEAFLYQKLVGY